MKNKKTELSLLLVVIFQIFLLTNLSVANSYIIHETNNIQDKKIIQTEKVKNLINSGLNLLIGFLSIKQIGVVSADSTEGCCIRDAEPFACFEVYGETDDINAQCNDYGATGNNIKQERCSNINECKKGYCWTEEKCNENTRKGNCAGEGEIWSETDSTCSGAQNEAKMGCCNEAKTMPPFMTRAECRKISIDFANPDFTEGGTEHSCNLEINTQEEGACIIESPGATLCRFGTKEECKSNTGKFWGGYLCSHPNFKNALSIEYKSRDYISCVNGKNEIYWFDSQGNRENIYGNNENDDELGLIIPKENSCAPDNENGNIDSADCGNCNFNLGSICAPFSEANTGTGIHIQDSDKGDFICKSLNCPKAPNEFKWAGTTRTLTENFKRNGETWCIYDSAIGDGKDPVGSVHMQASCVQGKVEVNVCGERRSEVCEETVTEINLKEDDGAKDDKDFSQAECVPNRGALCGKANEKMRMIKDDDGNEQMDFAEVAEACNKNSHCILKSVDVEKYFKFKTCVPKYPEGSDVGEDGYRTGASCVVANRDCVMIYVQSLSGNWDAKVNKKCETKDDFANQMNDLCISLGDCGNYINYIGKATDNVRITGEKVDGKKKRVPNNPTGYEDYKKHSEGEDYVKTTSFEELQDYLGGIGSTDPSDPSTIEGGSGWKGAGIGLGGLGALGLIPSMIFPALAPAAALAELGMAGEMALIFTGGETAGAGTAGGLSGAGIMGAVSSVAIGAVIGAYAGYKLAQATGKTGPVVYAMMATAAISGGLAGSVIFTYLIGSGLATGQLWLAGAALVITGLIAMSGWGDTKERKVSFSCEAWQAPQEGKDCGECHKYDGIKCTKYKCESLGQACELINTDTNKPLCIGKPESTNPAQISFKSESLDSEYIKTEGIDKMHWEIDKSDSSPIQELTQKIEFTLKTTKDETDEPAYTTCKWTLTPSAATPTYDLMEETYSEEEDNFASEHKFIIDLPDIYSANNLNLKSDTLNEYTGDIDMHVRCKNTAGIPNLNAFEIRFNMESGPDINVVDHSQTIFDPVDSSYLNFNTTSQEVNMWINEPADCGYSSEEGTAYDDMTMMNCEKGINEKDGIKGWLCKFTLDNFPSMENEIYIKCKDTAGNVNKQDEIYTLKKSLAELKINSIKFETTINGNTVIKNSGETIIGGNTAYPISLNLKVQTSGGTENTGVSTCVWAKLDNDGNLDGNYDLMQTTYSSSHEQLLNDWGLDGSRETTHKIKIRCYDNALQGGNVDEQEADITLKIDNAPPIVTRISKEGGSLKVTTNEPAECYYSTTDDGCNFAFDNEDITKMTTGLSTTHTADWNVGQIYYIKCADIFDNQNYGCAIKIVAEQSF